MFGITIEDGKQNHYLNFIFIQTLDSNFAFKFCFYMKLVTSQNYSLTENARLQNVRDRLARYMNRVQCLKDGNFILSQEVNIDCFYVFFLFVFLSDSDLINIIKKMLSFVYTAVHNPKF